MGESTIPLSRDRRAKKAKSFTRRSILNGLKIKVISDEKEK
jgi:hypothetical protein